MASKSHENLLRQHRLRVTAVRLAVMEIIETFPHSDTDFIIRQVRETLGSVSTQAIYNVLSSLCDANLARRIEPAGSSTLYELRVGDNHHHAVCRVCKATQDIDCLVGERPCLHPNDAQGFLLDEAEITFWGICQKCQAERAS